MAPVKLNNGENLTFNKVYMPKIPIIPKIPVIIKIELISVLIDYPG